MIKGTPTPPLNPTTLLLWLTQQAEISKLHKHSFPQLLHRTNANINLVLLVRAAETSHTPHVILRGGINAILSGIATGINLGGKLAVGTTKIAGAIVGKTSTIAAAASIGTTKLAGRAIIATTKAVGRNAMAASIGTTKLAGRAIIGTTKAVGRTARSVANVTYDSLRVKLGNTSNEDLRWVLSKDVARYNEFDRSIRSHLRERLKKLAEGIPKRKGLWSRVSGKLSGAENVRKRILREIFGVMACVVGDQSHQERATMEKQVEEINKAMRRSTALTGKDFSTVLRQLYRHAPVLLPNYNRGCSNRITVPIIESAKLRHSAPIRRLLGNIQLQDKEFNQILNLLLRIVIQFRSDPTQLEIKANPRYLAVQNYTKQMCFWQLQAIINKMTREDLESNYFLLALLVQLLNKTSDRLRLHTREAESYKEFQGVLKRVSTFGMNYIPSLIAPIVLRSFALALKNAELYYRFMRLPVNWDAYEDLWRSSNQSRDFIGLMGRLRAEHYPYDGHTLNNHRYSGSFSKVLLQKPGNTVELLLEASTFPARTNKAHKKTGKVNLIQQLKTMIKECKYRTFMANNISEFKDNSDIPESLVKPKKDFTFFAEISENDDNKDND